MAQARQPREVCVFMLLDPMLEHADATQPFVNLTHNQEPQTMPKGPSAGELCPNLEFRTVPRLPHHLQAKVTATGDKGGGVDYRRSSSGFSTLNPGTSRSPGHPCDTRPERPLQRHKRLQKIIQTST